MALDRPPMPPPEITGQMGQPPTQPPTEPGLASMMPQQGQPQPGAVNPNGELVAQTEAVKRVLEQIVRLNPIMAPFAQKCISILDTGISAVSQSPASGNNPGGGIQAMMAAKQAPAMA
jgi:hypothetical protein